MTLLLTTPFSTVDFHCPTPSWDTEIWSNECRFSVHSEPLYPHQSVVYRCTNASPMHSPSSDKHKLLGAASERGNLSEILPKSEAVLVFILNMNLQTNMEDLMEKGVCEVTEGDKIVALEAAGGALDLTVKDDVVRPRSSADTLPGERN